MTQMYAPTQRRFGMTLSHLWALKANPPRGVWDFFVRRNFVARVRSQKYLLMKGQNWRFCWFSPVLRATSV